MPLLRAAAMAAASWQRRWWRRCRLQVGWAPHRLCPDHTTQRIAWCYLPLILVYTAGGRLLRSSQRVCCCSLPSAAPPCAPPPASAAQSLATACCGCAAPSAPGLRSCARHCCTRGRAMQPLCATTRPPMRPRTFKHMENYK